MAEAAVAAESEDDDETPPQVSADRLWLVQCKRERRITPAMIKKHLRDIPDASTKGLYGVIFAAACDFSKATRDIFRSWCRENDISEAHIWGNAELEDQLYQPKNDGLLFAYFGFSLRVRRRSVKTELRAKLAMKRKAERILKNPYQKVLLRDPTEDRYPILTPDEKKAAPPRWRMASFFGHHPLGIMPEIRRYFAYLSDDIEQWDYVEKSVTLPVHPADNPWHEVTEDTAGNHDDERDKGFLGEFAEQE